MRLFCGKPNGNPRKCGGTLAVFCPYLLNFKMNLSPKKEILRQNERIGFLLFLPDIANSRLGFTPANGGIFILAFSLLSCAFLSGCMRLYKPVYIPTKCNVPKLERPALDSPLVSANIKALLIYTELLEKDLDFCRKGNLNTKELHGTESIRH